MKERTLSIIGIIAFVISMIVIAWLAITPLT